MEKGRFSISADDLNQRLGSAAVFLDGKVRFTATDDEKKVNCVGLSELQIE